MMFELNSLRRLTMSSSDCSSHSILLSLSLNYHHAKTITFALFMMGFPSFLAETTHFSKAPSSVENGIK